MEVGTQAKIGPRSKLAIILFLKNGDQKRPNKFLLLLTLLDKCVGRITDQSLDHVTVIKREVLIFYC